MCLNGEPPQTYYYVEIVVYSGNVSGVFKVDISVDSKQLKFAEFKKFDHSRGALVSFSKLDPNPIIATTWTALLFK